MRVISRRAIRTFAERYRDALEPLLHWANATEAVDWRTPRDVRRTFNSADFVGDLTVFDVEETSFAWSRSYTTAEGLFTLRMC